MIASAPAAFVSPTCRQCKRRSQVFLHGVDLHSSLFSSHRRIIPPLTQVEEGKRKIEVCRGSIDATPKRTMTQNSLLWVFFQKHLLPPKKNTNSGEKVYCHKGKPRRTAGFNYTVLCVLGENKLKRKLRLFILSKIPALLTFPNKTECGKEKKDPSPPLPPFQRWSVPPSVRWWTSFESGGGGQRGT